MGKNNKSIHKSTKTKIKKIQKLQIGLLKRDPHYIDSFVSTICTLYSINSFLCVCLHLLTTLQQYKKNHQSPKLIIYKFLYYTFFNKIIFLHNLKKHFIYKNVSMYLLRMLIGDTNPHQSISLTLMLLLIIIDYLYVTSTL